MNRIFKFSAALPLIIAAAGCSSDQQVPEVTEKGSFSVVMSIAGSEMSRATTPNISDSYKKEYLNFGTYNPNGTLKHYLYHGATNDKNSSLEVDYFTPTWGPSVCATLPRDQYSTDFFVGCFNVPDKLRKAGASKFTLAEMDNEAMNVLEWPGTEQNKYVWSPEIEDGKDMPMAGIVKVTPEYMKLYNPTIYYGATPFRLPNIEMTRALAKIVIIDKSGFIGKVEVKTPRYGRLTPNREDWMGGKKIVRPALPTGVNTSETYTQTKIDADDTNEDGEAVYIFYVFESSFYDAQGNLLPALDDKRKEIITLYASDTSGLVGTSRETTPVRFAPYTGGVVDDTMDLATENDGAWLGVMRNTVYTFTIDKPLQGGLSVQASVSKWQYEQDHFTF